MPDEVLQLERPHPEAAAQAHDRGRSPSASLRRSCSCAQRLQAERAGAAVDEEPGDVGGVDHVLAHRVTRGAGDRQRPVAALHARDHLDQAHHGRRVEEVHPDDALGTVHGGGDRRDRDRRGVRGQDAVRADDLARQAPEEVGLQRQRFGRGLDHEVAGGEGGQVVDGVQALPRRRDVLAGQAPARLRALEPGHDLPRAALGGARQRVVEQRRRAHRAGELRDAGAHRAGAGDADDQRQLAGARDDGLGRRRDHRLQRVDAR